MVQDGVFWTIASDLELSDIRFLQLDLPISIV